MIRITPIHDGHLVGEAGVEVELHDVPVQEAAHPPRPLKRVAPPEVDCGDVRPPQRGLGVR